MDCGEIGTGEHSGREERTEALVAPSPLEGRHGLPVVGHRPRIVAPGMVGEAERVVRQRLLDDLPAGRRERQDAFAGGDGLVIRAREVGIAGPRAQDLSQPTRVVEGRHEGLGLAQIPRHASRVLERAEGYAQGEPEVDGLLEGVAPLRQVGERAERLLKGPCGLAGGRARHGLLPRLPAIRHGLVPHLAPQGMVGQPFHLLGHRPRRGPPGPRRCGRAARAAAPGAASRRPPAG